MTAYNEIADYQWLTSTAAAALLAELAEEHAPLHTVVARLRRIFSPQRTHLLIEQVELRRRAAEKFTKAQKMFFSRLSLEQATDQWVAAYKSDRIRTLFGTHVTPSVADLCSGIGGDSLALAARAPVASVDRDPIATHLAAANAEALNLSSNMKTHCRDVSEFDLSSSCAWHIDPDRRPGGKRTTSLEWCEPNLETIEQLLADCPHAAIKLAPAADVPDHWRHSCELEWISRDHECKQLIAWHGDLAILRGLRQATVITRAAQPVRSVSGQPDLTVEITPQPNEYVFDFDAAVRAAHLTGTLAREHGLKSLAAGPTYYTGPYAIHDPAMSCFRVDEILPLRVRQLADHLRERGVGQLEIKKRGVEIDPEKLRRDLKLRGANAATILIANLAGSPTAIVANRVIPK